MPKKKLHNRIESLFADLKTEVGEVPEAKPAGEEAASTLMPGEEMPAVSIAPVKEDLEIPSPAPKEETIGPVEQQKIQVPAPKPLSTFHTEDQVVMTVPFKIDEQEIAYLEVIDDAERQWSEDECRLVEQVTDQLSLALENARLFQETRQRVQELSTLYDVSQSIASATMLSMEIAHTIVTRFAALMNMERVSLWLNKEEDDRLHLAATYAGKGGSWMSFFEDAADQTIPIYPSVAQVMQTLQPLILQANSPSLSSEEEAYFRENRLQTLAIVPLAVKGRSIGNIWLEEQQIPFLPSAAQVNLMMTIANAAAIALENARLYEEQIATAEKLREVDKLKSQFLANMSHELRTPLNSIIGFSRVILKGIDGPINEIQQQDLAAIHNAGTHLLQLINDILDISKIEAGKMELAFDDNVNLTDLIHSAMSTAIGLTKDKPIKLERRFDPDLPLVRADATRIRQVLINFFSNAAKFTDQGTITVAAYRSLSPEGQPEVTVSVTDTGSGISAEDQAKLFQPFSQVDSSPTRKVGGSGLGLSISRLLIDLHGGRIGLESELGKGSTFYFTLPVSGVVTPPEDFAVEYVSSPQGKTILVIEDDRQIIKLYERYLEDQGYQVVSLMDPFLSVETARHLQPFAITLDIMMPRHDGWQVLQELKSDPATRQIPVIICTIVENQEKGLNLGAVEYLMKPILQDDLVKALNRLNGDGSIQEILVVDDDPSDLRLVQKILESSSRYQVRLALGGPEGLAAIQIKPPQAIVLDLFMPELDGFTILETVRDDPALRDIPVIIFTAGDLTEEQHAHLAEFSQKMLFKSTFREEDLLESIQTVLHRLNLGKDRSPTESLIP